MLTQTIHALLQEKELNRTLKDALQEKVSELLTEAAAIDDLLRKVQNNLGALSQAIDEEFAARAAAFDALVGER